MISPTALMKRAGLGGQLVPFFKAVGVYFVLAPPAPGAGLVLAKCAPVLWLAVAALLGSCGNEPHARRVAAGLALSALGDALLVWPALLPAGMASFGAAHVAYLWALRAAPYAQGAGRAGVAGVGAAAAAAAYVGAVRPGGALGAGVALYAALLAALVWRSLAAARGAAGRAGAAGALMFAVSDSVLGMELFGGGAGAARVLVMPTYYLAQLGLALSALLPPPAPAAPPRAAPLVS